MGLIESAKGEISPTNAKKKVIWQWLWTERDDAPHNHGTPAMAWQWPRKQAMDLCDCSVWGGQRATQIETNHSLGIQTIPAKSKYPNDR